MRRALALGVLVVTAVGASACGGSGSSGSSAETSTIDPTSTTTTAVMQGTFTPAVAGKLTVQTSLPAPGWWEGTNAENLTGGYEYAMAKEIAKRLGVSKIAFTDVTYDTLIAGQSGDASTFDVGLAQAMISRRKKDVDFTIPYFPVDQGVMVNRGATVSASNLRDLRWGVQIGTTGQSLVEEQIKPSRAPREFAELDQLFAALKSGDVDAVMMDTIVELPQAEEQHAAVVAQFATGEAYGGVLPKGSPNLGPINRAISAMASDGSLAKLAEKWLVPALGGDPTKVPYLRLP